MQYYSQLNQLTGEEPAVRDAQPLCGDDHEQLRVLYLEKWQRGATRGRLQVGYADVC